MEIEKHLKILLDKYKLNKIYNKYKLYNYLLVIFNQSIYWAIIIFSMLAVRNPNNIIKYIFYICIIIIIELLLNKYSYTLRDELSTSLEYANNNYFNNNLINYSKYDLLKTDLDTYNKYTYDISRSFQYYIFNIKNKISIPFIFTRFIIISYNLKSPLITILGGLMYIFIFSIYNYKYYILKIVNNNSLNIEQNHKNYISSSRNNLLNSNINKKFINYNLINYKNIVESKYTVCSNINHYLNIGNIIFIFIVIYLNLKTINKNNFYYYLMIVYDILYINISIREYYRCRDFYDKVPNMLQYLFLHKPIDKNKLDNSIIRKKIDQIIINSIKNDKPKLILNDKLIINKGDHILVDGHSGMGKTSLFCILSGIINCDNIDISPPLDRIYDHIYITLPNYKNVYSANLYDIICNYNTNIDLDLVNLAILKSKLNIYDNVYVDINKISAGQISRLIIAQLIYTIKTNDYYEILLLDEIDQNINDQLSTEICKNLKEIFSDKIILYITHNDIIKNLFIKKLLIKNGNIKII